MAADYDQYNAVVAEKIFKNLLTDFEKTIGEEASPATIERLRQNAIDEAKRIESKRFSDLIWELYGIDYNTYLRLGGNNKPSFYENDPKFLEADNESRKQTRESIQVNYGDPVVYDDRPSSAGTGRVTETGDLKRTGLITPFVRSTDSSADSTGIPTDLVFGERYTRNPSGGYDYIQYNPETQQWVYSRGDKAGTPYNIGAGATTTPTTPTDPTTPTLTPPIPTGPYIIPDEKTQDDVNQDLLESTTNNQRFILDLLKYLPVDQWLVDVTTFDSNGNPITEKALSPAVQFYLDAWEKANGVALERETLQTDLRIADINARGGVDVARFGATPFGALAAAGADVNALQQALMTQSLGGQAGLTPEQRIQLALASTGGQYGALGGATGGYTAADIATLVRGGLTGQQMAQQALAATGGPFGALGLSAQAPTAAQITDLATRQALAQTGGPYGALTLLPSTSPVTFSNIESLARGGLTADQILQQTRAQYLPQLLQASPQSLGGLAAILGQEAVKNIYAPYTGQVPGLVSNESGTEQLLSGGSVPAFTQQQLQSNAPISTIGQYERQTPYEQGATLANISMLGLDPEKAMYGVTPGTGFTSGSLGAQAV